MEATLQAGDAAAIAIYAAASLLVEPIYQELLLR
jgi:hypothetical protein